MVAVDLESNNLHGGITPELVGRMPQLASVEKWQLANNRLDARLPPQIVTYFAQRCSSSRHACSGLPPFSCSAFGSWARLSIDDAHRCDPCDRDFTATKVLLAFAAVALVGSTIAFIVVMVRYPEVLRRWISVIFILVNHTQTLSVLGTLDVSWPPTVRYILSLLTIFRIEGVHRDARAECAD